MFNSYFFNRNIQTIYFGGLSFSSMEFTLEISADIVAYTIGFVWITNKLY